MRPILIIQKPDNSTVEVQATKEDCTNIRNHLSAVGQYKATFKLVLPPVESQPSASELPSSPDQIDDTAVQSIGIPIINNFLALCKKAPDQVINEFFVRDTSYDTMTRTLTAVTATFSFDAEDDPTNPDKSRTSWHAKLWRVLNCLRWCLLPNRKRLSSPKKLKPDTWKAISVEINPATLAAEPPRPRPVFEPQDHLVDGESLEDEVGRSLDN